MKKNIKVISMILILIAILLIIFGFVFNNKKTNTTNDSNKNDNETINSKFRNVECSKNVEDTDMYTYIEEDIINGDKDGNFTDGVSKQIYKYKSINNYNQLKNTMIDTIDNLEITYNDEENAIIYSKIITEVYNSKNEKIDITVKEYQDVLENNGYICKSR